MSQFFESICVKNGVAENLSFHQARVNKTLSSFDASHNSIELMTIVQELALPTHGLFKLRISYDLNGNYEAKCNPYQYKQINHFALVDMKGQSYNYKYANRDWIHEALAQSGKDEIMMHEDVLVGGEESGGISVKGHIPERDGIYDGLVIYEFMMATGKSLKELCQEIYNVIGEKVFQSSINNQQSEINLSNQPYGVYFMKIYERQAFYTKKVVIE
jgi:hypothetical protein